MKVNENDLLSVPVPKETDTYTPISHGSFISEIKQEIQKTNFSMKKVIYNANKPMTRVVGTFQLQSSIDNIIGPSIAFRNSYDKTMSAGLATGANVFACENGMFTGEITIMRKHTGKADEEISKYIVEEVARLQETFDVMQGFKSKLIPLKLRREVIYKLIGDLFFKDKVITSEQLNIFKREFFEPTIDYGVERTSAWNAYNLMTYAIEQKARPDNYLGQHQKVYEYFDKLSKTRI